MNILVIYQFCSFGGVERVLLNRAKTFQKNNLKVNISVGYLHDYGALQSFQTYIQSHKLDDYLSAFLITEKPVSNLDEYDLVLNIDTPQFFENTLHVKNMNVECHTPYVENRQYLRTLPKNVHGVIVPSEAFKSLLLREFPNLPPVYVLPNPVSEDFFDIPISENDRIYAKRPLAYLARLDKLKNFTEAGRIFELFAVNEDVMFAIVGSGAETVDMVCDLERKKILDKTFLRDKIDFDAIPAFVGMIKNHRGVFISPSMGESFGLSAAEFMSAGVPVLLSDIPAHRELVNGDKRFIYPLGDIALAKEKIVDLLNNWEDASKFMESYSQKFRGVSFVDAWKTYTDSQR